MEENILEDLYAVIRDLDQSHLCRQYHTTSPNPLHFQTIYSEIF